MARFPRSAKVGPFKYAIYRTDRADTLDEADGVCWTKIHEIHVVDDMSPLLTKERLVHELLHAVWDVAFVDAPDSWDRMEERFIRQMAPGLLGLLRENPCVVAYLCEKL